MHTSATNHAHPGADFRFSNLDFLKLAAPNTLSAVSMPLAGLINTAVVGQVDDASLIGGVAISSALLNIVFFAFNFMRSGTLGLTAQAFGAGNAAEEKAIAMRSALLAGGIGAMLICLQIPIAYVGLYAFGAEGDVRRAAEAYC
jgi:MATE family multidrug resistance protein